MSYFKWKKDIRGEDILWEDHVCNSADRWKAHTLHWKQAPYPTKNIRFEDMKTDAAKELEEAISFLGREVTEDDIEEAVGAARLDRAKEKVENKKLASKFYRKRNIGGERKRFSSDEKREVLKRVRPAIKQAGYTIEIESTNEVP